MERDVYAACPCGSGKKLKFCCHALVGEMDKLDKLLESQQTRMALQLVKQLADSHPQNPWVVTTYASILFSQGLVAEAKGPLGALLQSNPDHNTALALYALALFVSDGLEPARPAIYRAFQRCMRTRPDLMSRLAAGVAHAMYQAGKFLAARQHLVLAMRLAPEEMRSNIFLQLLELDGEVGIPYPLRSVQSLAPVGSKEEAADEQTRMAAACVAYGCWGPASRLYRQVAEESSADADLWRNAGICAAWDGDESAAAELLHRAAALYEEYETAVECETVAQLLDYATPEQSIPILSVEYGVESLSRLLTLLDGHERFVRATPPDEETEEDESVLQPSGRFEIVDRPLSTEPVSGDDESAEIAEVLAELNLFDESPQQELAPRAVLTAPEGESLDSAREMFAAAAGDLISEHKSDDRHVSGRVPRELSGLYWQFHFSPKTPVSTQRKLERRRWKKFVDDVWARTPLAALDGETPEHAAGDPRFRIRLAAALFVLDAYCARENYSIDLEGLFERFQLDRPRPIDVADDLPLNSLSAVKLQRLPVRELNDGQVLNVMNRALLIRHDRFLYDVLTEVLRRPDVTDDVSRLRAFSTLSQISRQECRHEEALQWIEKGKELAGRQEKPFENVLQWTLVELSLRLEDPSDAGVQPLLEHIGSYYGRKLPEVLQVVRELVERNGVTVPWESDHIVTPDSDAAKSPHSELWTPTSGPAAASDPKKLWIPGDG